MRAQSCGALALGLVARPPAPLEPDEQADGERHTEPDEKLFLGHADHPRGDCGPAGAEGAITGKTYAAALRAVRPSLMAAPRPTR